MSDMIFVYEEDIKHHRDISEALRLFYPECSFSFIKDIKTADIVVCNDHIRVFGKKIDTDDIKKGLIILLSDQTGYFPRFGLMTGMRPAQPGFKMLKEGFLAEEIKDLYINKYMVNEHAARILTDVIKNEADVLSAYDEAEFAALYVAVPFCAGVCSYCTFSAGYADDKTKERYISKLVIKIREASEYIKQAKRKIKNVYIGGGTPAELDIRQLDILLTEITRHTGDAVEYTFEAGRPDSLDKNKLMLLYNAGVTRICINTQSVNDKTLHDIGRGHTYDEFHKMYHIIRDMGFGCINSDLIIGFENETYEDMILSVGKIISLEPENISIHPLAIKKKRHIKIRDHARNDELIWYNIVQMLNEGGYMPYYLYRQKSCWNNQESAGFAIKGHECIYNIAMNEGYGMILGCGYKATSFMDKNRVPVSKNSFGIKNPF